jgi:hypothetical protein
MDSMNVSIKEDVLRVILVKNVTIEDALTQLEILGREKPEYTEHIKKIFDSVYWKLNNHLKDCKIEECILERLMALKDKRVACLERHIVVHPQFSLSSQVSHEEHLLLLIRSWNSLHILLILLHRDPMD